MASLLLLVPLLALQSSQQLTATELSLGPAASLAHETFAGAEVGFARRTSTQTRVGFAAAAGSRTGEAAMHLQLTLQVLVSPAARTGVGVYGGLGAAFSGREGATGQGFVAVLLGLEGAPGRSQSWYAELGLSGGVRVAAGWRLRWFPSWWRTRGS